MKLYWIPFTPMSKSVNNLEFYHLWYNALKFLWRAVIRLKFKIDTIIQHLGCVKRDQNMPYSRQ